MAKDVGVPVAKGSRVIMQVHYNLLAGPRPDVSSAQLRLAPGTAEAGPARDDAAARTRSSCPAVPGTTSRLLCDRTTAVADVQQRFGSDIGQTANYLHLLCGQGRAGPVQTCDREVQLTRHDPGGRGPHAPARPLDQDRGRPRHHEGQDRARHPGLGLRQPGRQAGPADRAEDRGHGAGHLPARPVPARPAAVVQGPAGEVRRLGRGHHRRDVPRHPAGDASGAQVSCHTTPGRPARRRSPRA